MSKRVRAAVTNMVFTKIMIYLAFVSAVAGSALLSFDIGLLSIFPYRVILPVLWIFLFIAVVIDRKLPDASHIKVKYYLWFMLAWFLYALLSFTWADSKIDAIRGIFLLFTGLSLIFFPAFYFTRLEDFKRFFHLWLIILAALLVIGFLNIFAGYQLIEFESLLQYTREDFLPDESYWMHLPRATFVHPNDYATYIALTIPFILTFIRYSRSRTKQLLGLALLFPTLFQLLLTGSRANLVAVALSVIFWFMFMLGRKEKIVLAVLGGSSALALIAKSPKYLREEFNSAMIKLAGLITGSNIVHDDFIRINLIRNSFVFLVQHYGFGVGAGNAEYHMKNFRIYDTYVINNVHNWWIEVLVNYGVFIFTGYVVFFAGLLVALYKAYREIEDNPTEKMICEALLMGMVAFIPASMSSSSIMGFGPQWVFFAFVLGFVNYHRLKQAQKT